MSLGEPLLEAIRSLARELEGQRLAQIAEVVRASDAADARRRLRRLGIRGEAARYVEELVDAWNANPRLGPEAVALALDAARYVVAGTTEERSIEVVWTGPQTEFVPLRRTDQVLLELVEAASDSLFLVSFVFHGPSVLERALRDALERGVRVSFLVERGREYGGALDRDPVRFLEEAFPGASIYTWAPPSSHEGSGGGVVHAKCAVQDGAAVLVTSANLTEAAMERNMELGLLVRGGSVPRAIGRHFDTLVATRCVVPVETRAESR